MASLYTVTRTREINASPATVFALINDFQQWRHWSPWEGLDPELNRTYSGATAGPGAKYGWSGNRKAGEGSMEITSQKHDQQVVVDLHFLKPFKSQATTTFTLTPSASGTSVEWKMEGPRPLMMRLMGPLLNMDKLVGRDFEKGLEQLAQQAEAPTTD